MYPCNHGSPLGFLEHPPGLLTEVKVEGEKSGRGLSEVKMMVPSAVCVMVISRRGGSRGEADMVVDGMQIRELLQE